MDNKINYYRVLELDESASVADIKQAYRKMAMRYHPDVNHEENASQKFEEIKLAYEILQDIKTKEADREAHSFYSAYDVFSDFLARAKTLREESFQENIFVKSYTDVKQKTKVLKEEENNWKDVINNAEDENSVNHQTIREAIIKSFIEEINNQKINLFDVYLRIYMYKQILNLNKLSYEKRRIFLMKQEIYINAIKKEQDYLNFIKYVNKYGDFDININLFIDPSLVNYNFNESISYTSLKPCWRCETIGCDYCDQTGYVEKEQTYRIQADLSKSNKRKVVIRGKGHETQWGKGNVNIKIIIKPNLLQTTGSTTKSEIEPYKKYSNELNSQAMQVSSKVLSYCSTQINEMYQLAKENPKLSIPLTILVFVVIILLAALL